MKRPIALLPFIGLISLAAVFARAGDWPEWRGLNRAAKATDFKAPSVWPEQLTPKWKVTVGEGDSTPSLVGDKLYVFARQDGNEVIRCLDANNGEEIWQEKYETARAEAPQHFGPRATPTVAEQKVVTFGVRGKLSCLDAATGKLLWRKDNFKSWPPFDTASSPIVVEGLCIAQVGGNEDGAIVAYDLTSGDEKWKWPGGSPSHASPALMTIDDRKFVVAQVAGKLVALDASNGKLAWETANGTAGGPGGRGGGFGRGRGQRGPGGPGERRGPGGDEQREGPARQGREGASQQPGPGGEAAQRGPEGARGQRGPGGSGRGGRGGGMTRDRFATTPIIDGQTIVYAGAGGTIKAVKLEKQGDKVSAKELWTNTDTENNSLAFNTPILKDGLLFGVNGLEKLFCIDAQTGKSAWVGPRDPSGSRGGYGSIVDAGAVLLAITPKSELIVFKPTATEYTEFARIKVADSPTFAHLVVAGNRLFVKDSDSVALFAID
ncbi:MAG: PQQ-binding-like beta-propeller repeat protein [Pirellulales bacterium]